MKIIRLFFLLLICSPIIAQETNIRLSDGKDVTQGANADAAVSGDVAGTISAKLRQLNKIITLSWDNVNNRFNINVANTPTFKISQAGTDNDVDANITNASLAITAAALPLPALASTSTKQSDGSQKTQIVDGSGNVIGSNGVGDAINVHLKTGASTLALDITLGLTNTKLDTIAGLQTTTNSKIDTVGAKIDTVISNQPTDTNSGLKSGETQRIVIATDQPQLTNALKVDGSAVTQPVSGTLTTTPPANASTNVTQLNGTTVSVNSGVKDNGTLKVVLATDQPALTNKLLVTPDSVALPANQSVNLAQVAGTNTVNGGLAGSQSVGGTGATNAAITQNPLLIGTEVVAQAASPAIATAGNLRRLTSTNEGVLIVKTYGQIRWGCGLNNLAATLTQCQAAPGAGLTLVLTDIIVQTTTTAAGTFSVQYGTGANCVTAPGALFPISGTANRWSSPTISQAPMHFQLVTPIFAAANNAICVIGVATNTINIQLGGYIVQ